MPTSRRDFLTRAVALAAGFVVGGAPAAAARSKSYRTLDQRAAPTEVFKLVQPIRHWYNDDFLIENSRRLEREKKKTSDRGSGRFGNAGGIR